MQLSEFDGRPLPAIWCERGDKIDVIRHLQGKGYPKAPSWWLMMFSPPERLRIIQHLREVGSIPKRGEGLSAPVQCYSGARGGGKSFIGPSTAERLRTSTPMLYSKPNEGKRMLPSIYTWIHNAWLKANSTRVDPLHMNNGHLENTLKLLKESHGNVSAKAQDLLGRMSHHYQNQPAIVAKLEEVCLMMQKVDVDDMYPIYKDLASELSTREPEYHIVAGSYGWPDDNLDEWMGQK
jgi:hypothetical protein